MITILLPVKYGSKKKVMKLSEIWGIRFYRYQLRCAVSHVIKLIE